MRLMPLTSIYEIWVLIFKRRFKGCAVSLIFQGRGGPYPSKNPFLGVGATPLGGFVALWAPSSSSSSSSSSSANLQFSPPLTIKPAFLHPPSSLQNAAIPVHLLIRFTPSGLMCSHLDSYMGRHKELPQKPLQL